MGAYLADSKWKIRKLASRACVRIDFESKVKRVSSSVRIEVSQISLFSLKRRLSKNIFLTQFTVKRYILGNDPTQLDALRFRV